MLGKFKVHYTSRGAPHSSLLQRPRPVFVRAVVTGIGVALQQVPSFGLRQFGSLSEIVRLYTFTEFDQPKEVAVLSAPV